VESFSSGSGDKAERILNAAFEVAVDYGIRRLTMEEVARRSGLTRVTVYSYFPKKDVLVSAMATVELSNFLTKVTDFRSAFVDPAEDLVETFVFAMTALGEHALLQRLLRTEPETLLPHIAFDSPTLALGRELVAQMWSGRIAQLAGVDVSSPAAQERVSQACDVVVRIAQSLVWSPGALTGPDANAYLRTVAERGVLPVARAAGEGL
jgi:AcrR family transcriptional regulator